MAVKTSQDRPDVAAALLVRAVLQFAIVFIFPGSGYFEQKLSGPDPKPGHGEEREATEEVRLSPIVEIYSRHRHQQLSITQRKKEITKGQELFLSRRATK